MNDTDIRTLFSEALTEEPPAPPALADDLARGRRRRTRRRLQIVAAGVVASAAVAFAVTVVQPQLTQRTEAPIELHLAPSSQTADRGDEPPRLLVDDPEWSIAHADEQDPDTGSLSYVLGENPPRSWEAGTYPAEAEISWRKAGTSLDQTLEEKWGSDDEENYTLTPVKLSGRDGALIAREGSMHAVMWHEDGYEMYVWTTFASRAEFEEFLSTVREVDSDAWFAAMPNDYEPVYDNSDAVAAMTEDAPLSEWFEHDLPSHNERLNRIEPTDTDALRQEVTYLVACYWVKQWIHSDLDGEPISINDELSTVVEWATDNDAKTDDVVWDYVESIIDGDADGQAMFDTAARDLRCGGW